MTDTGFIRTVLREVRQLSSRRLYIFAMVVIPLGTMLFLLGLMRHGLPLHIPTAIIDLDNTVETRSIVRELNSTAEVDITEKADNYGEAVRLMKEGKIFGFFVIPRNFTRDAMAGRQPQLAYYTNSTFYIPGSLLYRSLRTTSTLTSASMVRAYLVGAGATDRQVSAVLQQVRLQTIPLNNPWTNYSVYLANSFVPCTLALMILLVTSFRVCHEEKAGTSRQWLAGARDSMFVALWGKLLPQTVIFFAVGLLIQSALFGWLHYPLHCSAWTMVGTMLLFVLANQSLAVFFCGILPNLRLALSISSLTGVLSFSIGAFSFPLEQMYGGIGIFAYILPVRYYFLIYVDQALNGVPVYFSRLYFAALLVFLLLPFTVLPRLRKMCKQPAYVP